MDYKELIEYLRFLSNHVPEQMCDDEKDPLEDAATAIETLLAEREATEWISVEDRMPTEEKDNRFGERHAVSDLVLVVCEYEDGTRRVFDDITIDGRWCNYSGHVTHWMPLPTPPEQEKEENNGT